jgi:hypothetical protein
MAHKKIETEIVDAIREVIDQDLAAMGVHLVDVISGEDHDGDPVIFIDLRVDLDGLPIDMRKMVGLTTRLRDRLWEMGETRFPHVRKHIPDAKQVVGF